MSSRDLPKAMYNLGTWHIKASGGIRICNLNGHDIVAMWLIYGITSSSATHENPNQLSDAHPHVFQCVSLPFLT